MSRIKVELQPEPAVDNHTPDSASTAGHADVNMNETDPPNRQPSMTAEATANGVNILGHMAKSLVQKIDRLQSLGIQTSVDLPRIVAVGDQSAGKSSLIEGISGIKVPRSAGTCTRCPLQITTTPPTESDAPAWACTVTLQKQYDLYTGPPSRRARASGFNFGNWSVREDCVEIPFAQVFEREALPDLIHRAQLAILNPGDDAIRYASALDVNGLQPKVPFSPNIVKLDIRERGSPSLSFVDLPGVINNTEVYDDRWMVNPVQEITRMYVSQPNTLILLACSMESDMQNSLASSLVMACPGAMQRCIGVLTKPDRIPDLHTGSHANLLKVLSGETFKVGHGYFVAKQASQDEINMSREATRTQETNFFSQPPWSTILAQFSDRFGTEKLQVALSQKLADKIMESLPSINERLLARMDEIDTELLAYPDPPANALNNVMEALMSFRSTTERHVEGLGDEFEFRHVMNQTAMEFKKGLEALTPVLRLASPEQEVVDLLSDDEVDEQGTPCPPSYPRPQAKKRKMGPESATGTPKVSTPRSTFKGKATPYRPAPQTVQKKSYLLAEIRETLEQRSRALVPGEMDPRAVDHLRSLCLRGWHQPLEAFLNDAGTLIGNKLQQLLEESYSKWINTDFFRNSRRIVSDFVERIISIQRNHAERALRLEQYKPYTMNDEFIKMVQDETLTQIRLARYKKRAIEHLIKHEASTRKDGTPISEEMYKKRIETDAKLRNDVGPDPFALEVEVMAKIRAYYRLALLRFLDTVVQGFNFEVLEACKAELPQQLHAGLELDAALDVHARCARLLAEDPARKERRVHLKREKEKLVKAQEWLADLNAPAPPRIGLNVQMEEEVEA